MLKDAKESCAEKLLPILLLDVIYFLQVTIISACAQKDVTKVNSNYKLATNIICCDSWRVQQYILLLIRFPNLSFNISLNYSERNTLHTYQYITQSKPLFGSFRHRRQL